MYLLKEKKDTKQYDLRNNAHRKYLNVTQNQLNHKNDASYYINHIGYHRQQHITKTK